MANIIDASKDSEWALLGKNFVEVASANASTLGLTASQVSGLNSTYDTFDAGLSDVETKTAERAASIVSKDAARASFETLVRRYGKQWRGNTAVPNALLAQLTLAPRGVAPIFANPTQPLDLLANVNSVGEVKLSWRRNGNRSTTNFWIQILETNGTWSTLGTTTKSKFSYTGNPIGNEATFRVIAVRRDILSTPSFPVTIFGGGEEETNLQVAA